MRLTILMTICILSASRCQRAEINSSEKESLPKHEFVHFLEQRIIAMERFQTLLSSNNAKYRQLKEALMSMTERISESKDVVDLSGYRSVFAKHPSIDIKLWTKDKMTVAEALLLTDWAIYAVEKSDFCNVLYVFENMDMEFSETNKSVSYGAVDSIKYNLNFHNYPGRHAYYIGSKDSIGNKDYIAKHMVESEYITLPANKKGKQTIEGGMLTVKFNHVSFVPFSYTYIVE